MKSRGNPEVQSADEARGGRFGETRKPSRWQAGWCKPGVTRETISRGRKIRESGQPEERVIGDTEGPKFGATRRSVSRHRRRMRESRRLGAPSPVKPEVQNKGQPEDCIRSAAGGVRNRGNPGNRLNRQRGRHERVGATRGHMAGTAEGLKGRGNPELRRRRGSRVRGTGQPGNAGLAQAEDEGKRRLGTASTG